MKIDLQSNLDLVARELERKSSALPVVVKEAVGEAANSLFATSKRLLTQLIYNREIPFRRPKTGTGARGRFSQRRRRMTGGKLAWRRSYKLLNAERVSQSTDGQEFRIGTDASSPAAKYARARHNLNRKSPIDGKTRLAPWRAKAREVGERAAVEKFRQSLRRGLDD